MHRVERGTDLERERNGTVEFAGEVAAEIVFLRVPIGLVGVAAGDRIVAAVININGLAGAIDGAVSCWDDAAVVLEIVAADDDVGDGGRRGVEVTVVDVGAVGSGGGIKTGGVDAPDIATVAVFERVVFSLGDAFDVFAATVHGDGAHAGGGALREVAITGRAGAVSEAEHAAGDGEVVFAVLDAGGKRVGGAEAVVDADLALLGFENLREALPLARGLHEADEVPRGAFIGILGAGLALLRAPGGGGAHGDREVLVDGMQVVEFERRLDVFRTGARVRGAGAAVEGEAVAIMKHRVGVERKFRFLRFKAAARDEIDGAAEAARGHVGCRDLGDFDAGDVVHGHLAQIERAAVAVEGAGGLAAIDGEAGVITGETAEGDGGGFGARGRDRDAGKEEQELTDVLVTAVAVFVDGDDTLKIRGVALLVHRDGLRAHLAVFHDGEFIQLDGGCVGGAGVAREDEFELALHETAGGDGNSGTLALHADVGDVDPCGADRDAGETVGAALVGDSGTRLALEGDAGVDEGIATRGVKHAALDRAGGSGSLRGQRNGER